MIKLCLTVALPIMVGLLLKVHYEGLDERPGKYAHKISSVFMLLTTALFIILKYNIMFQLIGSRVPVAAVIFIGTSFMTGYLLGGPERGTRLAMALMHDGRNAAIALMIANQVYRDQLKVA